jgi:hypothetical protein
MMNFFFKSARTISKIAECKEWKNLGATLFEENNHGLNLTLNVE